ncbi:unnamed protein product [Penicillium pancosmium]
MTEELIVQRDESPEEFGPIFDLYEYLHGMKVTVFAGQLSLPGALSDLATSNSQVGWYNVSECLWSSTTDIQGRVTLNDDYEDLKDLFELTSLSGDTASYSPSPAFDFQYKAYAILRVTHTFKSFRYKTDGQELYRILQTAKIEVTDTINTVLRISQDGKINDVEGSGAKLHIAEHASNLTFYVPRDKRSQHLCFRKFLPEQLVDWLMRDSTTQVLQIDKIEEEMVNVMANIFCIDPSGLYEILSREGIDEIDIINMEMRVDDDDEDEDEDYEGSHSEDDLRR